jgi:hypothetical protein
METSGETLMWRILFGMGVVIALGSLVGFAWFTFNDYRAQSWPSVTGRVIESTIERSRSSRRTQHSPKITYSYEVAGRQYQNNHIWLNESKSFRDYGKALDVVGLYKAGGPAQVFYDPADPARSRLIASGRPWYFLFGLAVGLLLILFPRWWRARTRPRNA